ncbi:unnamed protein product [Ambrosiozyma monospora]|uniref:Unnamed protein product n=1 Tax=Ambrosiozyma monospora TaxID=43982 RepID=A0ACB5U8P3_AMBMO|nr:unnamed protein product [Ambrosiozyma monospora]
MVVFAMVSHEHDFKRPEIVDSSVIDVQNAGDPLSSDHIPNNFTLNEKIMILTGPNYSGKSTLLLKVGLLVFLSHIGCFIPGTGKIGLTNRILTRMNSRESVGKLQSTFMRDSMQMARCLSRCTPKSLILMDEFGKGTDVIDGPALLSAFSIPCPVQPYEGCC